MIIDTRITKLTLKIARELIGKRIEYLRKGDRSPRGNFYRQARVTGVQGRNIEIDNSDWLYFGELVSIEVLEKSN